MDDENILTLADFRRIVEWMSAEPTPEQRAAEIIRNTYINTALMCLNKCKEKICPDVWKILKMYFIRMY